MSETDDELLPCPFCGNENARYYSNSGDYGTGHIVECPECSCRTSETDYKEHAILAWNRREAATRIASLTARVSEVRAEALEEAAKAASKTELTGDDDDTTYLEGYYAGRFDAAQSIRSLIPKP